MSIEPIRRYHPNYRSSEISLISSLVKQGESLALMGIAGTGKSNIIKFLRDKEYVSQYLGDQTDSIVFVEVNGITWQKTPDHLWNLMMSGIQDVAGSESVSINSKGRILDDLRAAINDICNYQRSKLVFLLDDFDDVISRGPDFMLEQLSDFRSDGRRGLLSYILFVKKLPHILGREHNPDFEHKSKFYDLFRRNIYAMGLYNEIDSENMIATLNQGLDIPLQRKYHATIAALAGGHAGLIKTIFNCWITEGEPKERPLDYFSSKPEIQIECDRILAGLHPDEKKVAIAVAKEGPTPIYQEIMEGLQIRGILLQLDPPTWFSPLFPYVLGRL